VKVCFFLFIVISVICMSILKVSCSVFLNWVCWTRGNLLASRVTYAFMCASPLCGVPGRYEYIFGHSAGVGGGTVRISSFSGSVLGGTVRWKWWGGGAVFHFSLFSVCCQFPWRVDMRGRDIAFLSSMVFVVVSCGSYFPVVDC